MKISVDLVRKLAKLDPRAREAFYSYVEELEKDIEPSITKDDLKPLLDKLADLESIKDIAKEFETIKNQNLDLKSKIEDLLNNANKKISEIEAKFGSLKEEISKKLEEVISTNKKTLEEIKSKKDVDIDKLTSFIEQNNKNIKGLIEEIKDKFQSVTNSFSSSLYNRVLSKLSKGLKKKFNINTKERIRSKSFEIEGKKLSFPLYTEGTKNKIKYAVVGKMIATPTKDDIENFISELELLKNSKKISSQVQGLLVVEEIEDELEKFAEKKGVLVVWTQDL